MKEEVRKLLHKALRAVNVAERLAESGEHDFAAARAYYAMFDAARALLVDRGLRFRKHGGVHAAFGEHFAKTGALDPKFHRWLLDAFDARLQADYGLDIQLTASDVQRIIAQAREFEREARRFLTPPQPN